MLTIWYNDKPNEFDQWVIGQDWPLLIDYHLIRHIVAWDRELEFILLNFKNLPCLYNSKEMCWFGDMAKTIIWGLVLLSEDEHV